MFHMAHRMWSSGSALWPVLARLSHDVISHRDMRNTHPMPVDDVLTAGLYMGRHDTLADQRTLEHADESSSP